MSSSNSSSESDSELDVGDEESLQKVFAAMKQNLSNFSLKSSGKVGENRVSNERRLMLYQTFESDSSRSESDSEGDSDQNRSGSGKEDDIPAFFIDKGPRLSSSEDPNGDTKQTEEGVVSFDLSNIGDVESSKGDSESEQFKSKTQKNKKQLKQKKKKKKKDSDGLSSSIKLDLKTEDVYVNVDPYNFPKSKKSVSNYIQKHMEPEVMKKSVITDDYEKLDSITSTHVSVRQAKKERKIEREKTKGDKWYNLPATEMTDERKHDIAVLKMRKALDPKRFYKANDLKVAPKYFQFGKVVEDPTDFYSSRIPKKQRKATIVEELLADSDFRQYNKRKYEEVQEAKRMGKGPYKHMKRLKKRKK